MSAVFTGQLIIMVFFFRGEKLYLTFPRGRINQEQHVARFCCWIVSLILLAGALTVAALIGGNKLITDDLEEQSLKQSTFSWSNKVTNSRGVQ